MTQAISNRRYNDRERQIRIRRRKRRQMLRIKKLICVLLFFTIFMMVRKMYHLGFFHLVKDFASDTICSDSYHNYDLTTPQKLSDDEILSKLNSLSEKYPEFNSINEHSGDYPIALLNALVNNPEMIDFAKDYPGNSGDAKGGLTHSEIKSDYPLFIQWDKRWGYASYGGSDIGLSGCGPTCLSMVAYALTRNEDYTPATVSQYAADNGFYVEGTGTSWSLMTDGASHFGITGKEISLDESVMKNQLDQGHPIICILRAGDFTASGHFIMIYKYDDKGFYVNDPNSHIRSDKQWTFDELNWQIRDLWAYNK